MSRKNPMTTRAENEAIEWLAKLNAPSVTQAQEQEFFNWLNASPLHQAAYIKAEELWQRGEVLARVSEPEQKRMWSFYGWQSLAVACACLFIVAIVLAPQFSDQTQTYTFQTAIGEQQEVTLEDGSTIILNTNSSITFHFNRNQRLARLERGEVFFKVTPDQGRPFDVVTEQGVVRVVGTQFSVRQSGADAVVTVVEGEVALGQSSIDSAFETDLILEANERSTLSSAKSGQAAEKIDASAVLSWRKKQLIFRGQSLREVVQELNRYSSEMITLDDPVLGDREVTAVIQITDMSRALKTLEQSLNLRVEVQADKSIRLFPNSGPSTH